MDAAVSAWVSEETASQFTETLQVISCPEGIGRLFEGPLLSNLLSIFMRQQ